MSGVRQELRFLASLWKANLLGAMEYRVAFLTQVIGMVLNNSALLVFWAIFFGRFQDVWGWSLDRILVLFGVVTTSYGLGMFLFGGVLRLSESIVSGKLDYYLVLPRPALLHLLAGRGMTAGIGDALYGIACFVLAGPHGPAAVGRFVLAVAASMTVLLSFLVLVHSAGFWMGSARLLAAQALDATITFSTYPTAIFGGGARALLYTVIPAAFVGAVPASFVEAWDGARLAWMLGAAAALLAAALLVFHRGLRRYESGNGIEVQA